MYSTYCIRESQYFVVDLALCYIRFYSVSDLGIHPTDIQRRDDTLYVYSWLTREIIALSILTLCAQSFYGNGHSSMESLSMKPCQQQLFHDDTRMTKTGYIACAHCHPAGDHDGQTWDFTDRGRLRNTTSLPDVSRW